MATPVFDVSYVIVSYNTVELTLRCLTSLAADLHACRGRAEVILVDNQSSDATVERVAAEHPRVRVVQNETNLGFGAGNNRGMQAAHSDLFILLNSDAFVRPGFTTALLAYMQGQPHVGVAGPLLLNEDLSVQRSVFRFPTPTRAWLENLGLSYVFSSHPVLGDYRQWGYDTEREVDWVSGACMVVRRAVFEQGGFDERFFMYSEETDWQRTIRQRGWSIAFVPSAVAVHRGGGSGARARLPLNQHFFRSLDLYVQKNHGTCGWLSFRLAMVVGAVLRLAVWAGAALLRRGRGAQAWEQARFYAAVAWRQSTVW
jgi:hypothetical protein